jgi:hypothetical protein
MDVSVQSLRDGLEGFLHELGTLHYRFSAGLTQSLPLRELYASHPELGRPESFAAVKEALERSGADAYERARLGLLLEFLAGQVEDFMSAAALEEVAQLEANAAIKLGDETLALQDALALLPREPLRERRDALERMVGEFLWKHQDLYARWRECGPRAAEALGYRSYLSLREAVTGESVAELSAQCEMVLRDTEAAYRDVLGYALKRLDPALKVQAAAGARRHDLLRVATAPWLAQHYRHEDLMPVARRWLGDMGFDPNAHGRIQIDTDERPGKSSRAFVADVDVPDDIRLVVRPGNGLDDYYSLLHEFGHALHLAHIAKTTPVEARRLGDASVSAGFAYTFDHVLLDPAWHRRYLRLPQTAADDGARLSAFSNLMLLRRYCAKLPYELALYERGPLRPLAESYEGRQSAALLVGVHPGFYLYDVDPQLQATRYLRAWALEASLHTTLQERFDQDYWRNPATGRWLMELFAHGQPERAEQLAQRLGGKLSLSDAARRLVDALNR